MQPGSIVLSHDFNQPDTIAAYKKLLPWLAERFAFAIPGDPAPEPTTPPAVETPTETPATPDPATSSPPAAPPPADAAEAGNAGKATE